MPPRGDGIIVRIGGTMKVESLIGLPGIKYVASPYSQYITLDAAARDVSVVTGKLMKMGMTGVYSPIAHGHAVSHHHGGIDNLDAEWWEAQDADFVEAAVACIVVTLPGWEKSKGVSHEIASFMAAGKPVVYVSPEEV